MNIFSLGMDTLAEELKRHDIDATVDNYAEWQTLADAVMEMAAYLGRKGVPVALVVPFDGTQSFAASGNVARVLNLTQRKYAYMRGGPGFHGALDNVDVSSDRSIDHITIDKSPRLHARVVAAVLAVVGNHKGAPAKNGNGADADTAGTLPEQGGSRQNADGPVPHLRTSRQLVRNHFRYRIEIAAGKCTSCFNHRPSGIVTSQMSPSARQSRPSCNTRCTTSIVQGTSKQRPLTGYSPVGPALSSMVATQRQDEIPGPPGAAHLRAGETLSGQSCRSVHRQLGVLSAR
jgi:hypothetical protein